MGLQGLMLGFGFSFAEMENKDSNPYWVGSDELSTLVDEDLRLSKDKIGNTKPFVNHGELLNLKLASFLFMLHTLCSC